MSADENRKKARLGRGLSALFGEEAELAAVSDGPRPPPKQLPIEFLAPGKYQPRRAFDEEAIAQLADSIREKGLLQPILVREIGGGRFEIVAGERRWRAAQRAGLHEVPVVVRDLSDRDAAEIALVENVQRQDLSALEEAEGYRRLIEEFQHTQEEVAKAVGKSRSHVANMMRLLALPDGVKKLVADGALSAGHARALLVAPDPEKLAQEVARKGLNVRQTEKLVKAAEDAPPAAQAPAPTAAKPRGAPAKDSDTAALEHELSNILGLSVSIDVYAKGGVLSVEYQSLDQLDDVVRRLTRRD